MHSNRLYNGIVLVNKPAGITSHDTVLRIRRALKQRRVGHTGTLDKRAAGLLVVCVGRATKIVQFVSDFDKVYEAEIRFGRRSRTFDAEGVDQSQPALPPPEWTEEEFNEYLDRYRGKIIQKVPPFSAVHVDGKRLHEMARRGEEFEPPEREVEIKDLRVIAYEKPSLRIRVRCTSGTYIRSLAEDMGNDIGCGAYLARLVRTSVGNLRLKDALPLPRLERICMMEEIENHLIPVESVLGYGSVHVTDDFRRFVVSGRPLTAADVTGIEGRFSAGDNILMKDQRGNALAIGKAGAPSSEILKVEGVELFKYLRVLN